MFVYVQRMRYICSIKLKQQILTTMATITINTTTRREANEIIREIQYNDMGAVYSDDMDTITTDELTATVLLNNNIVVSSDKISEDRLTLLFRCR